jgi:o-succinylbenzoate---CoA ligase
MTEQRVKIGNQWLILSGLKEYEITDSLSDHEKKAIKLCQTWINNKQDFEFHTSGSTGTPKTIRFKRSQLIASAKLTARALDLKPSDTSLICLDTDFIAGAMMVVRSMVTGMNMIIEAPSANPLEAITDKVDFIALVPYQISEIIEKTPSKLDHVGTVIIGGAPLKKDVIETLQRFSAKFYATYGMTETITHVALQKLNGPDRQDYFQLLPGISALLDSRECLIIEAEHLGMPVVTNDIVELIDVDTFRWLGRYDQVINSGGIKISPEKIEQAVEIVFQELKISNRFFVAGINDPKLGKKVTLIIEGTADSAIIEKIKIQLAERLDKYEVPKEILFADHFAETASQKIDRMNTLKFHFNHEQ